MIQPRAVIALRAAGAIFFLLVAVGAALAGAKDLAALPPVISRDSSDFAYASRSPSGLPIEPHDVLAERNSGDATGFSVSPDEAQDRILGPLPQNTVALIARSRGLTSAQLSVKLAHDGPSAADTLKPKLYALLVGVTGYTDPEWNTVLYAAHDAEELAKALRAQKGGLYADVQTDIIADATRNNVLDGFYWLQHAATSRDLAVVFLAGHGTVDAKHNFWFLTREADLARLRVTAISDDDLVAMISSISGKKVVFLDACYAGAAMVGSRAADATPDMNKVVDDFSTAGSGLVVFSASTGTEHALEDAKWDRHGAFTKALVEAIGEGKASIDSSGRITTDLLDHYLVDRVKDLTGGQQHPVMSRPVLLPDFPNRPRLRGADAGAGRRRPFRADRPGQSVVAAWRLA